MHARLQAFIFLTIASAIWGFGIPLIKKGYSQTTPIEFLFYRYFSAMIICLPIAICQWKKIKFKRTALPELIGIGLLANVVSHILIYGGLDKTSSMETALITSLTPICIAIGGVFFLGEKIKSREWWGIVIAFLGSLVIVLEPIIFGNNQMSLSHTTGNLMVLANCLTWAGAMLWMKKVVKKYHPFAITFVTFTVACLSYLFILLFIQDGWQPLLMLSKPYGLAASLYQGIVGSVIALYLYQYGQKFVAASEAGLFNYLIPLFSVPLAILWLGEIPTLLLLVGGAIIIVGIVIAEKK